KESGSVSKTTCGRELTHHKRLANILRITRARKATNPRDKVYGIMGLMSRHDIASPGLVVGYSLPVLDVYLSACVACMEVQGAHANITFLQDAGSMAITNQERPHARVTTEGEYWPSWIPDWTEALPTSSGLLMGCLQADGSSVSKGRASNATIFAQHEHNWAGGKRSLPTGSGNTRFDRPRLYPPSWQRLVQRLL
ncbi:hypothetical protein BKA58DRAFT_460355, partial [Alternaria rosae]|uniref:uncharacterized protein n=1 Tax=Alternaria rosae TaxID=1187941 RepID=UPI001E8E9FB5